MPQLPGPTAIPLQPAQADRPMATYRGDIVGQAQEQAAQSNAQVFGRITASADEIEQANERLAVAHASQAFLAAKLDADKDAIGDQDYATLPQRYQARVSQALQQSAAGIVSPAMRAQFMASFGYMVNRSADGVIRDSYAKGIQADRDWLNNYVGGSIDGAMKAADNETQDLFLDGAHRAIEGMRLKGSVTAAEAKQLMGQTTASFAERSAKTLIAADPRAAWQTLIPAGEEGAPGLQSRFGPGTVQIPSKSRLSFANNNPGNLKFAGQDGATQGDNGFAKFPTPEAGMDALYRQVGLDASRGATLGQFINKFAPDSENDTDLYLKQVTQATGAGADTRLSDIPRDQLVSFLAGKESGTAIPAARPQGSTAQPIAGEPRWLQYLPLDKRMMLAREARDKADAIMQHQITLSDKAEREADHMRTEAQKGNFGQLFADALSGKDIDPASMADMVRHQLITPEQANAVNAQLTRAGKTNDDIPTLLDLQSRADKGQDISEDVYKAIDSGDLTGKTAARLLHTTDTRSRQDANQIERASFATLRTIAGGDAVEKGMLNLDNAAHVSQMQLWSQAQQEWNDRVLLKHQDPTAVLADMTPRYAHPIERPDALPTPRFGGRPNSGADLGKVVQSVQDAFDARQLTPDQFDSERRLLLQYKAIFDQDARRQAAAASVPKGIAKPLSPSSP